jgi:hypothetical protein
MEYEPLNPLVHKTLQSITKRIGHAIKCPICGGEEWSAIHNRFLRLSTPFDMTEAEVDAASDAELDANIRAIALVCERCAFVSLHAIPEEFGEGE